MSLEYVLDGYNITNHPAFSSSSVKNKDQRAALIELIVKYKLCGSAKNKIVIVFDGYPLDRQYRNTCGTPEVIYSFDETADEKIRKLAQKSANPKVMVVVSDDREVKFFAKAAGAKSQGVEEFMRFDKQTIRQPKPKDLSKDALSYSQVDNINKELKDLWLK